MHIKNDVVFRQAKASDFAVATILALSVSTLATSTYAQSAPPADGGKVAATPAADGEIIVTARKQSERISDVPIAIQAFSSKQIELYATQSFAGLSAQVPGLDVANGTTAGNVNITLRGIGSAGNGAATLDQAVAVNLDGLQVGKGNLLRLGFHDMERIEVLKGPQALFFGKNSPGGVVSLVSKDPGSDFEASVKAGYEFYAKQKFIEGVVSAPLAEGLGLRVVGYLSGQDGWFRNLARTATRKSLGDRDEYFVRGTLRYDSGGGFDNTLKVSYGGFTTHSGLSGAAQRFACPFGSAAIEPSPPAISNCKIDRYIVIGYPSPAFQAGNPLIRDGLFHKQNQLAIVNSANLEVAPELSIASVSTYFKSREQSTDNFLYSEQSLLIGGNIAHDKQFTQEVRATSHYDGPVNFMAGGFYQHEDYDSRYPALVDVGLFSGPPIGVPVTLADNRFRQKTEAYSVFGQLTFALAQQVDFEIGGRYSHEKKSVTGEAVTASVFNPVAGPLVFPVPSKSFDDFSPQATLRYKPSDNLMIYATYRTGFISGGYNLVLSSNEKPFSQEKAKGGEAGMKAALFNRQVRFDLAAYHYKYSGVQLGQFDPATVSNIVTNATSAKSYGVDASLQFSPRAVPGLSLRGALSWNHARYGTWLDSGCYAGQSIAAGCNLNLFNGAFQSQDLTGHRLLRAFDWAGNIGATYERPVADGIVMGVSADAAYKGAYNPNPQEDPRARQAPSWLLNGNFTVRAEDNSWEAALIGRNLTNKLRLSDANAVTFSGFGTGTANSVPSDLEGVVTEPRSVMFQITLRNKLFQR
ncbi:TonB-dependent receptor [Aquisediminimonas profunda]|uniref:TonB-dependent receptor n=1 Tax=Aquisediminimonas profunda TaxID=1550733 RepID=UPI001C63058B|nr:TonB-dependent receptor [Aquisediminimonas profunda]